MSEEMKTFIERMFMEMKAAVQEDIRTRFDKLGNEISQLKASLSQNEGPSTVREDHGRCQSESPSAKLGKDEGENPVKSSQLKASSTARSPRPVRKELAYGDNDVFGSTGLHDVNLSQSSNIDLEMETQAYLTKMMGHLSEETEVKGFDPSQLIKAKGTLEVLTPLSSYKAWVYKTPSLKDVELPESRAKDKDYGLVFVAEDLWNKVVEWSTTSTELRLGPSMLTKELSARVVGPRDWLKNHEIDAMLYVYCERCSLRLWSPNKVAFMNCIFSSQMKTSYQLFKKDKKKFKVEGVLHQYDIGELPAHGRTRQMWDLDFNRMYVPLLVHGNHWIALFVKFVTRLIEVFDCEGMKHNKDVEPFTTLIPRIVKAVQSTTNKKHLNVTPYTVSHVPMPFLNKSSSDCGVYALKHIKCHLLGLDLTLVNDDNIGEARQKIAYDLWEAANAPQFIQRMSEFTPPKTFTNHVVEIV